MSDQPRPTPIPCGGCGATDPRDRCIGCGHEFFPETPAPTDVILAEKIERVRLAAGNNQFTIRLCGELAEICHLALESDARAEEIKELREIIGRDQLGKACIYWMDRYHKLAQSDDNPDSRQTISVPKSLIPNGGKLVECYETEREFVICGEVDSDDESHDCDSMGCGSFSHVIARIPKVDLEQGWPIERAENAKLREEVVFVEKFGDAVADMFDQLVKGKWIDDNDHPVSNNATMLRLKELMQEVLSFRQALAGKEEG